ncbi:MAG: hypothetical protein WBE94_23160, partial [Pseudolabrys sp.]
CLNGLLMSAAEKRCVRVFLRQATTPRQIKNKDNQLGVQNQINFAELVADATSDPFRGESGHRLDVEKV